MEMWSSRPDNAPSIQTQTSVDPRVALRRKSEKNFSDFLKVEGSNICPITLRAIPSASAVPNANINTLNFIANFRLFFDSQQI